MTNKVTEGCAACGARGCDKCGGRGYTEQAPLEDGDTPCENCRVLWPALALAGNGFCPDCVAKYQRDMV